jgi:hypothetical protein
MDDYSEQDRKDLEREINGLPPIVNLGEEDLRELLTSSLSVVEVSSRLSQMMDQVLIYMQGEGRDVSILRETLEQLDGEPTKTIAVLTKFWQDAK